MNKRFATTYIKKNKRKKLTIHQTNVVKFVFISYQVFNSIKIYSNYHRLKLAD